MLLIGLIDVLRSSEPGITLGSQPGAGDAAFDIFFKPELWIAVVVSLFLGALLSSALRSNNTSNNTSNNGSNNANNSSKSNNHSNNKQKKH